MLDLLLQQLALEVAGMFPVAMTVTTGLVVGIVAVCVAAVTIFWKPPLRIALHTVMQAIRGLFSPSATLDPPVIGDSHQPHRGRQQDEHCVEYKQSTSIEGTKAAVPSASKETAAEKVTMAVTENTITSTAATGISSPSSPSTSSTAALSKQQPQPSVAGSGARSAVHPAPQRRRRRRQLPTPTPSKTSSINSLAVARSPTGSVSSVRSAKRSLPPTPRGATPVRRRSPNSGAGGFSPLGAKTQGLEQREDSAHANSLSQSVTRHRSPLTQAHRSAAEKRKHQHQQLQPQQQQQKQQQLQLQLQQNAQQQQQKQRVVVNHNHLQDRVASTDKARSAQSPPAHLVDGGTRKYTAQTFGFATPHPNQKPHRSSSPGLLTASTPPSVVGTQDKRKRRVRFSDPVISPLPPSGGSTQEPSLSAHKQGSKRKGKKKGGQKKGDRTKNKSFKWPKLFGRKKKSSLSRTATEPS